MFENYLKIAEESSVTNGGLSSCGNSQSAGGELAARLAAEKSVFNPPRIEYSAQKFEEGAVQDEFEDVRG